MPTTPPAHPQAKPAFEHAPVATCPAGRPADRPAAPESQAADDFPRNTASRPVRWALAVLGVVCVVVAAVGVIVPGLPTTIFLIVASWSLTRSCPYLERKLLALPIFRPFLRYMRPGAVMPLRALVWTLAIMWTAIAFSLAAIIRADAPVLALASVPAAGAIGTVFILRASAFCRRA